MPVWSSQAGTRPRRSRLARAQAWRVPHARYRKIVQRTRKFLAHDETNTCGEGDLVRIQETRPLSKLKHWRVVEIVERAR